MCKFSVVKDAVIRHIMHLTLLVKILKKYKSAKTPVKPVEEAVEQAIKSEGNVQILKDYSEYTGIMAVEVSVKQKQNRAEAKQVSIYEYDEEKHMRQEREASWEEGKFEGKIELLRMQIQKKLVKGKSISEISEELEEEEDVIAEMIREMGEERATGKEEQ